MLKFTILIGNLLTLNYFRINSGMNKIMSTCYKIKLFIAVFQKINYLSSNIIFTVCFRYMKELREEGHVFIAKPPVYLEKKGAKKEYAWNDKERDDIVEKFGEGCKIQRYKGLGEMNADQLWETTMKPSKRTLRQIVIDNGTEADRVFSMLMGDEVPPRREFIERNAGYAHIDA